MGVLYALAVRPPPLTRSLSRWRGRTLTIRINARHTASSLADSGSSVAMRPRILASLSNPRDQRKSLEAGSVSELEGIARFEFHEGKLEEFKRLAALCMEVVRTKDTGTLQYDIYFNEDQSECIVHERYRDSDALIEHAAHLGDLNGAVLATGFVSGVLLGEPSAELRAIMADSEVRLFTLYQSM